MKRLLILALVLFATACGSEQGTPAESNLKAGDFCTVFNPCGSGTYCCWGTCYQDGQKCLF